MGQSNQAHEVGDSAQAVARFTGSRSWITTNSWGLRPFILPPASQASAVLLKQALSVIKVLLLAKLEEFPKSL
jgi:hypothetical protein